MSDQANIYPFFVGAYGENDEFLEKILLEFLRDHIYWRRNFHPEDQWRIPTQAQYSDDFLESIAKMKQELHSLSTKLKRSTPLFSPRYIGHMSSDLLLPGLLAQLITTLYNPNNVAPDVAPVTVPLEIEVGLQLSEFPFGKDRCWLLQRGDNHLFLAIFLCCAAHNLPQGIED